MHALLLSNKICNTAEIRINGVRANVLIDSCTFAADLISPKFCHLHHILTEEMPRKSLFTAINGSKSTMTKEPTLEVDVQGHKEIRTLLVSNLLDWHAIIGHPMGHHLNTVMRIKDTRVSIQLIGKMRYDLPKLGKETETPVMPAAATFTEACNSSHDSLITYASSSHAYDRETNEDTTDSSASDSQEEPALSHHTSDNDS